MDRVGIRKFSRDPVAWIRRAIAGEIIEITREGRPVARIVPLRGGSVLDQMVAEGRATKARGDLLDIKPMPRIPGEPSPSQFLDRPQDR